MPQITIIIADDHSVVREGTRKILESDPGIKILADISNGKDAINMTLLKKPDILMLDISMPGINGIEVLKEIKRKNPKQKVVMFTAHADLQYVKAAVQENVDGYLTKNIDSAYLIKSLNKILDGNIVLSEDISSQMASCLLHNGKKPNNLTSRECEILILLAKGKSNQEIAADLFIAVRTVETHVANILKKLKLANRTQLSSYAYENGLV